MMVWRGGLTGVSPGFQVVWLPGDHIISTVGLPCKHACGDALAARSLQKKRSRTVDGKEEKKVETEESRQQSYVSGRMADGWTCVGRESHGSWG